MAFRTVYYKINTFYWNPTIHFSQSQCEHIERGHLIVRNIPLVRRALTVLAVKSHKHFGEHRRLHRRIRHVPIVPLPVPPEVGPLRGRHVAGTAQSNRKHIDEAVPTIGATLQQVHAHRNSTANIRQAEVHHMHAWIVSGHKHIRDNLLVALWRRNALNAVQLVGAHVLRERCSGLPSVTFVRLRYDNQMCFVREKKPANSTSTQHIERFP